MSAASTAFSGLAWKMTSVGKPSDAALNKQETRSLPSPTEDQVLVKVAGVALNPIDYKLAEGHMRAAGTPPLYMAGDFAGVVVEAGAKSGFSKGQEVFGDLLNKSEANPLGGSLSEYILVPGKIIALKPNGLTATDAASLSLVGQTVLDCVAKAEAKRKLPEGARVLILGASGGVGKMGVQICQARGFHTIGVCSGKNRDLVMSLGASEVIDYKEHDWSEKLKDDKVDVVFDFAPSGADSTTAWEKAIKVLKPGRIGEFITISGPDEKGEVSLGKLVDMLARVAWRNTFSGFKHRFVLKQASTAKLETLKEYVEGGTLKPVVEKVYPFSDVPKAYDHLMSGRAVGKICVSVP